MSRPPANTFTTHQMSKRHGVTARTLRFYCEKELLKPITVGTTRHFTEQDNVAMGVIKNGKAVGLDLTQIYQHMNATRTGLVLPSTIVSKCLEDAEAAREDMIARTLGITAHLAAANCGFVVIGAEA